MADAGARRLGWLAGLMLLLVAIVVALVAFRGPEADWPARPVSDAGGPPLPYLEKPLIPAGLRDDGSVEIELAAANLGGDADQGSITLSVDGPADLSAPRSTTRDARIYQAGTCVLVAEDASPAASTGQPCNGTRKSRSTMPIAEAFIGRPRGWGHDAGHTLRVKITSTAHDLSHVTLYARVTLTKNGTDYTFPPRDWKRASADQQYYAAIAWTLDAPIALAQRAPATPRPVPVATADVRVAALERGNALYAAADFAGAASQYETVARRYAGFKEAYLLLGHARLANEQYRDAIDAYGKAIDADPNYAQAYFSRAWVRWFLGDLDDAAADEQTVLKLDPENYLALRQLVRILKEGRRYAALAALFADHADTHPKAKVDDEINRLDALMRAESFDVLGDESARAADDPAFAKYKTDLLYYQGYALNRKARYADAVGPLESALEGARALRAVQRHGTVDHVEAPATIVLTGGRTIHASRDTTILVGKHATALDDVSPGTAIELEEPNWQSLRRLALELRDAYVGNDDSDKAQTLAAEMDDEIAALGEPAQ